MIPEADSTLELGGPGGAGQTPAYKQLMSRKPSAAQPLSARTNIAAFGSGVGQALMGSRMGKVMNAASGGYQDLYKAKAYPNALHKQITGPAPDDTENATMDLIREHDMMSKGKLSPGAKLKPF